MPSWSGFWGANANDYNLLVNKNPRRNAVRRTVNRESFREATALFNALIGAVTGSNVTATRGRVRHVHGPQTPQLTRPVETVTVVNRNTTAGDVTFLKEMVFNVLTRPAVYPADRSGNGGPRFG